MALGRVQATPTATTGFGASVSAIFATPPPVGNGIVFAVLGSSPFVAPPTAVTDNWGNTYQRVAFKTSSVFAQTAAIYYCAAIAATGASFTVTVASGVGSVSLTARAIEVSGVGGGLVVDQIVQTAGSSSAVATGPTPALTAAEALLATAFVCNNNGTITVETVTPPWTEEFDTGGGAAIGEFDTRVVTGATGATPSCSWTSTGGGVWAAVLVAFKATAAAATETRITQDVAELLSLPSPDARITQAVTELLAGTVAVAPPTTPSQLTQAVTELLSLPVPAASVTQALVEVLQGPPPTPLRVTQLSVDVFRPLVVGAFVTQAAVELFTRRTGLAFTTQLVVEIFLRLPPCAAGTFPVDIVAPGGSCPARLLD